MKRTGRWDNMLPQLGKPTEGQVVNACIKWLFAHGCYVWRQNVGAFKPDGSNRFIRFGMAGLADILGVTPSGRFIACECKVGKNKQQNAQIEFQRRVEEKNGIYVLAYSVDDLEARTREILA